MKKGYHIFGKEYGIMFKNDLHAEGSIDREIVEHMILLDRDSEVFLYGSEQIKINSDMIHHELFDFAQQFKGKTDIQTVESVVSFTSHIVKNFDLDFKDMLFGGTEKQIIERGTDWCTDISRVGCVLLQCLNIPCRMVVLVNSKKAYHGHTLCETYVNGDYMMCDFTYGVYGYTNKSLSVREMVQDKKLIEEVYEKAVSKDQNFNYFVGLFDRVGISSYDPADDHDYTISRPNQYYIDMMKLEHNGFWQLGECE